MIYGGEGGIRTHVRALTWVGFQGRSLKSTTSPKGQNLLA